MNKNADVVVIGGGAVGTAITYYLAKKGLKTILVEKKDYAEGTSSKCEGHLAVHDTEPGYFSRLSKLSLDMYPSLIDELEYDVHYKEMGIGLLCETEEEVEYAKKIMKGKIEEGIPARFVDQYELQQREKYIAKDILGYVDYQCDSQLDPMYLCYGLALEAKKNGAEILNYTTVKDISLNEKGEVEKVITDRGDITTKTVVNATGVWAPEIGKMVGLDIPIRPRQGQILITERTSVKVVQQSYSEFGYVLTKKGKKRSSVTPEMDEYGVALVIESTPADNYLIGSSRIFGDMNTKNSIEVIKAIAQRAMRFFPILEDINIIRTYAGVRPSTPDGYPIISDTKVPGFYIAAGHEGNGISLAPITGKLISQIICGEERDIETKAVNFSRFQENN